MEIGTMQCRIFRDPEMNRWIDSDPEHIIIIDKYYPKYDRPYRDMDKFSNMILDVKKDEKRINLQERYYYKKAINYFVNWLQSILSYEDKYVICVFPTSKEGPAFTGMRAIAKQLSKDSSQIIDGTDVLSRAFDVPKKSMGGKRDLDEEIKSLTVNNRNIIRDQQVLLMDDITTTGTSLKAGRYMLKQAGAKKVALFALGKTQSKNIGRGELEQKNALLAPDKTNNLKYCLHEKFKIKEYNEERGYLIYCPLHDITIREGATLCNQCKYHSLTRV